MLRFITAVLGVLLISPAWGEAQSPLVGVWEMTYFETATGEGEPTEPAFSAWFENGFYVVMWDISEGPRPTYGEDASDAELVAAWGPFVAQFGTYEIDGSSYNATQLVAKNPESQGSTFTREWSVTGDVLVTSTPGGSTWTYRRVD